MGLLDNMRAAADAINWTPETGDGLEGTVIAIDRNRSSDFTPRYTAVTLRTDAGLVYIFHAYHGVAAQELEDALRRGLQPGDLFAVVYNGKRAPKGKGRPFHHYSVGWEAIGERVAGAQMPELPEMPDGAPF